MDQGKLFWALQLRKCGEQGSMRDEDLFRMVIQTQIQIVGMFVDSRITFQKKKNIETTEL